MSENDIILKWVDFFNKKKENSQIFKTSFIHPSYKGYNPMVETNENLELIGDRVLDLTLYHYLYNKFTDSISKKQMDDLRQKLLSATGLEKIFDALNLEKSVEKPPNHKLTFNSKVKHNIVEALVGATYLEDGYEIAYNFITELLKKDLKTKITELEDYIIHK